MQKRGFAFQQIRKDNGRMKAYVGLEMAPGAPDFTGAS